MATETLFGIDLGGTKIEGAIIEYDATRPLEMKTLTRLRVPTEKEKGYEHIINQIKVLIKKVEQETLKR